MKTARGRGPAGPATVVVAGDWAPIRDFDRLLAEDPRGGCGEFLPALSQADLRIVNCECALADAGEAVWKSGSVFKGRPAHVGALTAVPFEAACLANNHVLDYGVEGLAQTLETLRGAGIRTVGAGLSEAEAWAPLTLELPGVRLSLVNFSEGEDLTGTRGGPGVAGWEVPRACALVRELKRAGHFVLAVAHAGLEYVPFPPPYLRQAFRSIIEAGADCVVGHHPHVPQGVESHEGRPIFYSLGNFLFYQPTNLYWRKVGFLLELEIAGAGLAGYSLRPYRITDRGVRPLDAEEHGAFDARLRDISRPLAEPGAADQAWQAFLDYYGAEGLRQELAGIVAELQARPPKGAAMLRNRLTTPQHTELWRELLPRLIRGAKPAAPAELTALVAEWFQRTLPPG